MKTITALILGGVAAAVVVGLATSASAKPALPTGGPPPPSPTPPASLKVGDNVQVPVEFLLDKLSVPTNVNDPAVQELMSRTRTVSAHPGAVAHIQIKSIDGNLASGFITALSSANASTSVPNGVILGTFPLSAAKKM